MESKEIKVYGTLVNETVGTVTDASHNDILMNAYLLYDSRFINNGGVNNYQDVINKRLTAITYANGVTTITGDLTVTGNISGLNFVRNLSDLQDVDTTGIASNKYLKYNGTKWVPASISITEITEFADLGNASEGQVLKYRNGKWRPSADLVGENPITTINGLDDVDTTGATNGSVLKYNGTTWVVGSDNTGNNGATDLNGLSDVTLSSSSSNQVLSYNGSQWINKTINLSDISMPSAQEGQVLKYSNGSWVAANDETGTSIESGTQYIKYEIPLLKVAYKTNMAATKTPCWDATTSTSELRPGDNIAYVYMSNAPLILSEDEEVVTKKVYLSQFETAPYTRNFSSAYPTAVVNRNAGGGGEERYYLDGTLVSSATATYMQPGLMTPTILSQTQSTNVNLSTIYPHGVEVGLSFDELNRYRYLVPVYGIGSNYSIPTSIIVSDLQTNNPDIKTLSNYLNGSYITLVENGLLINYGWGTSSFSQSINNDIYISKYTEVNTNGGENGLIHRATTLTEAQAKLKMNWSTNEYYVEVPPKYISFSVWFGSDYNAPNTITASIITRRITNTVNVNQ